jgi:hypothetical protein
MCNYFYTRKEIERLRELGYGTPLPRPRKRGTGGHMRCNDEAGRDPTRDPERPENPPLHEES